MVKKVSYLVGSTLDGPSVVEHFVDGCDEAQRKGKNEVKSSLAIGNKKKPDYNRRNLKTNNHKKSENPN